MCCKYERYFYEVKIISLTYKSEIIYFTIYTIIFFQLIYLNLFLVILAQIM